MCIRDSDIAVQQLGPHGGTGGTTAYPVSYTHLDVYKRQDHRAPAYA